MNLGKRLRNIRMFRQLTQQALGEKLGFKDNSSYIRIAQYEIGQRSPRTSILLKLAEVLRVEPEAIAIPTVNDTTEFMHLLFALEEFFGMKIAEADNAACLKFEDETLQSLLTEWLEKFRSFQNGDISEYEYKEWQYNYTKRK